MQPPRNSSPPGQSSVADAPRDAGVGSRHRRSLGASPASVSGVLRGEAAQEPQGGVTSLCDGGARSTLRPGTPAPGAQVAVHCSPEQRNAGGGPATSSFLGHSYCFTESTLLPKQGGSLSALFFLE